MLTCIRRTGERAGNGQLKCCDQKVGYQQQQQQRQQQQQQQYRNHNSRTTIKLQSDKGWSCLTLTAFIGSGTDSNWISVGDHDGNRNDCISVQKSFVEERQEGGGGRGGQVIGGVTR